MAPRRDQSPSPSSPSSPSSSPSFPPSPFPSPASSSFSSSSSSPSSPSSSGSPNQSPPGDTIVIGGNTDTCLVVAGHDRVTYIWVSHHSIISASEPLRERFEDPAYTSQVQVTPSGVHLYFVSLVWFHTEALVILLKVLGHVPGAFPNPSEMDFTTFWQLAAALEHFEIEFVDWFDPYYRHWRGKKLEPGYEGWLVAGRVFQDKEGYARLVAMVILEFTGWDDGEGRLCLKGPEWRKGPDGGEVELREKLDGRELFRHMREERGRLKAELTATINTWFAYMVHLKASRKLTCTCSPTENCVSAAREISGTLKSHHIIPSKHFAGSYHGSILDLRLLFQSLEVKLSRGITSMAYNECKIYNSMTKLIRDMDAILGEVKGATYDGEIEKFGIRDVCPKEMVLPWTNGQFAAGIFCAGALGIGAGMLAWGGFKMFLKGMVKLDKAIS
ncbi:hypothetical protein TWF481_003101 [Arthrobotrys musiformis]|uniref:Uncharacterized protein n=1 Tax=Arthrobotrys musiformis TaxID=47236 RepID=A0AAV9VRG1_9PEZI